MISVRKPNELYHAGGRIQDGTFQGLWHFSFDGYYDPEYTSFGTLRVFNDDTLSPGAIWPLHPHRKNEVVTYVADGEFRHADERGKGGILKKGWVQHTTIGKGMFHAEINNRQDKPMRFIQMWFYPEKPDLDPLVTQKKVEKTERTNRLLPLVSNDHKNALPIHSNVRIYSCFLQANKIVDYSLEKNRGMYICVLEGGSITVNNHQVPTYGAAKIIGESELQIIAKSDVELLLVDVSLIEDYIGN